MIDSLQVFFQIVAIVIGVGAAIWSGSIVVELAPKAGMEVEPETWLTVFASFLSVPFSLVALAVGLGLRKGSPPLRVVCIVTSLVALSLPVVAILILQSMEAARARHFEKLGAALRAESRRNLPGGPWKPQRRLTDQQMATLVQDLSPLKGHKLKISCFSNDPESRVFATDFVKVFKQAGWLGLDGNEIQLAPDSGTFIGLFMMVSLSDGADGGPPSDGAAFVNALSRAGVLEARYITKASWVKAPWIPAGGMELSVGRNRDKPGPDYGTANDDELEAMAVADTPLGRGSISQKSNAASADSERHTEQIDAPALVKAARPSGSRYEFETANYWGKSYKTIDNATDPQECARACNEDSQCRVASFHGPNATGGWANRCVLRQAVGERHAEQVDISSWVKPNGGITPVQLAVEALPGKLLISVNVAANCSAGGASVRATPDGVATVEVRAGSVLVTCSADEHDEASADVEVAPGKAVPLKLALKRVSAGEAGGGGGESKSGLSFVSIPAGTFQYQGERSVSVQAFRLGATAVTVEAYSRCVQAGACTEPTAIGQCNWKRARANHPINCVDWNQATAFCRWIGGRLPTEEEREYVAVGGDEGRTYPWGNEEPGARACWNGEGSDLGKGNRRTTCPVGSHQAGDSKWGLHDLAGNVWEWTSSDYDSSSKVVRGGSWDFDLPGLLRARYRLQAEPPLMVSAGTGFRCGL